MIIYKYTSPSNLFCCFNLCKYIFNPLCYSFYGTPVEDLHIALPFLETIHFTLIRSSCIIAVTEVSAKERKERREHTRGHINTSIQKHTHTVHRERTHGSSWRQPDCVERCGDETGDAAQNSRREPAVVECKFTQRGILRGQTLHSEMWQQKEVLKKCLCTHIPVSNPNSKIKNTF